MNVDKNIECEKNKELGKYRTCVELYKVGKNTESRKEIQNVGKY